MVEAPEGGSGLALEFEDYYFVASLAEPGAGEIEGLLGPYVPDAAKALAVDPALTLGEGAGVEEGGGEVRGRRRVDCLEPLLFSFCEMGEPSAGRLHAEVDQDDRGDRHAVEDDELVAAGDRRASEEMPQRDKGKQAAGNHGPAGPTETSPEEPEHKAFEEHHRDADDGGGEHGEREADKTVRFVQQHGQRAGEDRDEVQEDGDGHESCGEFDSVGSLHRIASVTYRRAGGHAAIGCTEVLQGGGGGAAILRTTEGQPGGNRETATAVVEPALPRGRGRG